MKIQYASDLHFEFSDNYSYMKRNPLKPVGDILILAGDIGYLGDDNYSKYPFWDYVSDNFEKVIVGVGNHELHKYYDMSQIPRGEVCTIRENVRCYYDAVVQVENVNLIISTLWSKISLEDAYLTEQGVSDFYRILYDGELLTFEKFNREHERCFHFIQESVAKSTSKHIIVVTHHVPSFQLVSPEFVGSRINGAFTVELGEYIETSPVEYWIYGHSHRNINKIIGNTQCHSNQLGYVHHNEYHTFDPGKIIEL